MILTLLFLGFTLDLEVNLSKFSIGLALVVCVQMWPVYGYRLCADVDCVRM